MSDKYTPTTPGEHRLMPNMLRVLGGNRALADQVIAEVEDSLWLAEHEAAIRRDQIEKDAQIVELVYPLGSQVLGNAPGRIAAAIRAQIGDTNEQ